MTVVIIIIIVVFIIIFSVIVIVDVVCDVGDGFAHFGKNFWRLVRNRNHVRNN